MNVFFLFLTHFNFTIVISKELFPEFKKSKWKINNISYIYVSTCYVNTRSTLSLIIMTILHVLVNI